MKTYNFSKIISRQHSDALKIEALPVLYGRKDLLPLWVADMDFATPDFIIKAIKKRLKHPILGYSVEPPAYKKAIADWLASHHGWEVKPGEISYIHGVVKGIGLAINYFVKPDEKIIIQPPVYHIFERVIRGNNRGLVYNPLIQNADGSFSMDFEGLEKACDAKCRMLILSNPHNPGGVVWDAGTLSRLASFCHKKGIIVIADEIHCDMTLWGNKHTPFATVSSEARECCISLGAPSKTFNIPGIVSSYAVVHNRKLREGFYGWLTANELNEPTVFAPIATIAAYKKGEDWRRQMLAYVEGNIDFVIDYCRANIPQIKPVRPQASFLVWLDCRDLGLAHDDLVDLFVNKARLALNDGEIFGPGGEGFMRLNVATPRKNVRLALDSLKEEVRG